MTINRMILILCLLALLINGASLTFAQTDFRGWNENGQTWLVWSADFPDPFTYDVYVADAPIGSLDDATLIGRVFPKEYKADRLKIADDDGAWVIPDGAGETYTLEQGEGLFVYTPHAAKPEYFAVVKHEETDVSAQNTTGPIEQELDPVRCYRQLQGSWEDEKYGLDFTLYAMWIDGRADHTDGRDDFLVMGNQHANGTANVFMVTEPIKGRTDGLMPAILAMHGTADAGSYADYSPRIREIWSFNLDLDHGFLVALDDNLYVYKSPDGIPLVESEKTRFFGYWEGYNRFEIPTEAVPDDALVVNYTLRRFDFILDWLLKNEAIDPARISVFGFSGGGSGATFYARWRPEMISAGMMMFPPLTGSIKPFSMYLQGSENQNLRTNLPGDIGMTDLYWPGTMIRDTDLPLLRYLFGRYDPIEFWATTIAAVDDLNAINSGAQIFWDERSHGFGSLTAHWYPSTKLTGEALVEFRSDRSFPAFSNEDQDPDMPGRQPDMGNGMPDSGDEWGTFGGFLDWDHETLTDLSDTWAATIFLTSKSSASVDIPDFDRCTVDVTVKKRQAFLPEPGMLLKWTLMRLSDSVLLDEGKITVQTTAPITIENLSITKQPARLNIYCPQCPQSDDDDDDDADEPANDDDSEGDNDGDRDSCCGCGD